MSINRELIEELKDTVPKPSELKDQKDQVSKEELEKWFRETIKAINNKLIKSSGKTIYFDYSNSSSIYNKINKQKLLNEHAESVADVFKDNYRVNIHRMSISSSYRFSSYEVTQLEITPIKDE